MSKTRTEDISSIYVSGGDSETYYLDKKPMRNDTITVTYKLSNSLDIDETFTYGTAKTATVTRTGAYTINGTIAYDGDNKFVFSNDSGSTGSIIGVSIQYSTDEDSIYAYRFDKSKVDLDGLFLSKQYVKEYAVGEEVIPQGSQRLFSDTLSAYYQTEIPAGYNILACSAAKVETDEGYYFIVPVYLKKTASTPTWAWSTGIVKNETSGDLNVTSISMQVVYVKRNFINAE